MQLAGGVALVTGASAGIGAATARRLSTAGALTLVHGRDPGRTATVAAELNATAVVADLLETTGVASLTEQALAAHGRVDILVANAGRGHSGPFTAMTEAEIDELLTLDLATALRVTHRLLPGMLGRGRGHLCYVTSIAGRTGVAGEAVYAAAKSGLDAFAESLRLELVGSGVGVSVVVPAAVDTGFFHGRGRAYDRRSPRPVAAETVAAAVVEAIEHDRAEVFVPGWTRVAPAVRALAPRPFRALSVRYGEPLRAIQDGNGS